MSRIYNFNKEEIKDIINNSNTQIEVLNKLGFSGKGSSYITLKRVVSEYELTKEYEELFTRSREQSIKNNNGFSKIKKDEEVFVENSSYPTNNLKRRIIKRNLLDYKCSLCGNEGVWQGKEISLQLHHVNGINNDNRLENLRFLCPNCHSQTENWGVKNSKKDKLNKKDLNRINFEEIMKNRFEKIKEVDLTKSGWIVKVSKIWGVSHSQVRRLMNKYYPEVKTYKRNMPDMV